MLRESVAIHIPFVLISCTAFESGRGGLVQRRSPFEYTASLRLSKIPLRHPTVRTVGLTDHHVSSTHIHLLAPYAAADPDHKSDLDGEVA